MFLIRARTMWTAGNTPSRCMSLARMTRLRARTSESPRHDDRSSTHNESGPMSALVLIQVSGSLPRLLGMQAHEQVAARPQNEQRLRVSLNAGDEMQVEMLRDAGDDQGCLHQAEAVADALARPGA